MKKFEISIQEQSKSVSLLKNKATKITIKNDKDVIAATEFLKKIKVKIKELETERKTYTAPINQSLKAINSKFTEITEPLKNAETEVKKAIVEFRSKQEEKRLKEEAKLQKKSGDSDIHIEEAPRTIESKSGSIRARKMWTFEMQEESKIPRKYLMIDETKIKQDIGVGVRKIPGLIIYQKEIVSVY